MPLSTARQGIDLTNPPDKFILFGEDDPDDEEILREVFQTVDKSFVISFQNTGRKLITALESMPDNQLPCLVVLDYNMPELNGAEILKALKQNSRYDSIPKLIWSTSGSETFKTTCLALGAEEYFIKPSSLNELTQLASKMLHFC